MNTARNAVAAANRRLVFAETLIYIPRLCARCACLDTSVLHFGMQPSA